MHQRLLAFISGSLLLCLSTPANAQTPKEVKAKLLEIVQKARQKHKVPAMAGAVILNGKLAAVATDGVRVTSKKVRVTDNDLFHIGSCTKAMTATLIGRLVEAGVLKWEADLEDLLPKLKKSMHGGYRFVKLSHLLSHQSGIVANIPKGKSFAKLHNLKGTPQQQRLQYAKMVLAVKPYREPGTNYLYSNAAYAVAAVVAEEATGKSWEQLMKQYVFGPLKMDSVGHGSMGTPGKLDQPIQHRSVLGFPVPVDPGPKSDNPVVSGPAGRVHCSITDWSKFIVSHLQGARGKDNLLKAKTYKYLHTTHYKGVYALGWVRVKRKWGGGEVLTHSGSNTMNFATVWIAPKRNFAVLAATNHGGGFLACDNVASGCIAAFLSTKKNGKKKK